MSIKQYFKRTLRWIIKGIPIKYISLNIQQIQYNKMFCKKNFIITGGSSGIGFEIAKKVLQCGGRVLITGRDKEKLDVAKTRLGADCFALAFDSAEIEKCDSFLEEANRILDGDVDSLICNAGITLNEQDILHVDIEGYKTCAPEKLYQ